jgi:hypothetical protein
LGEALLFLLFGHGLGGSWWVCNQINAALIR